MDTKFFLIAFLNVAIVASHVVPPSNQPSSRTKRANEPNPRPNFLSSDDPVASANRWTGLASAITTNLRRGDRGKRANAPNGNLGGRGRGSTLSRSKRGMNIPKSSSWWTKLGSAITPILKSVANVLKNGGRRG